MKATKAEEKGLITLLTRIYHEIHAIESAWGIQVDDRDFRPRIDYFHDAVRALTAGDAQQATRLSVAMLAYDIRMLRFIQSQPWKSKAQPGGPASGMLQKMPNTDDRLQLADLYKHYALLFAALLSDAAERDYRRRTQSLNAEKDDLAALEKAVAPHLGGGKKGAEMDVSALVNAHANDAAHANAQLFGGTKPKKRLPAAEILRRIRERRKEVDKEAKKVNDIHLTYATSQLAIYEESRDTVKKMAFRGLNIVGVFVENAIREALRGGRGI